MGEPSTSTTTATTATAATPDLTADLTPDERAELARLRVAYDHLAATLAARTARQEDVLRAIGSDLARVYLRHGAPYGMGDEAMLSWVREQVRQIAGRESGGGGKDD